MQLYEITDGKLRVNMHPGQTRAWESEARIVAVIAGSQGGKTSFGPWWLWREINRCGAGDYIAATSSYDLFKLKMLPEIRNVFEHTLGIGRYWSGDKILEIRNPVTGKFEANRADDPMWARIILRSAASGGGLESSTAAAAWGDEVGQDEFTLDSFEALKRRLTLRRGRILITTTPYNLGWLKQMIVDKEDGEYIQVINFPSVANPAFSEEEFEEQRRNTADWKFKLFYLGQFSRPAGMIYADFNDAYRHEGGHKVKPFDIPSTWTRYLGVDPGAVHNAKIWLAHDTAEDIYYLYRETLAGGKSNAEHASEVLKTGERIIQAYVGQKAEVQVRLDWQNAGMLNVAEPPFHDVEAGIDKVTMLLRQHRLYIFDTCTGLLDEMGRYSRKLDKMGEPTEEIKDKATFHRLDALRYVVAGVTDQMGVIRKDKAPAILANHRG
jgi:hypothetical protein